MRNAKEAFFVGLLAMLMPMAAFSQAQKRARAGTAKLEIAQCALRVSGMTCTGCTGMVEKGLLKVEGVITAKADFKADEAQVTFDKPKTTPEKIVAAFNREDPGFRVQMAKIGAK